MLKSYTLTLIAEGNCPITGRALTRLTETITVEAASLADARKLAPLKMNIRLQGRVLMVFSEDGTELLGNF
jgi:hypothetical protein